jgi:deoxyhypusine synthase
MAYNKYPLLDKRKIRKISIHDRKSLVDTKDFAQIHIPGSDMVEFFNSLPNFLAAHDFKELVIHLKNARKNDKPIVLGIGAHLIKVGLSPIIIDLMERGWISAIAANGAFMIHDFEIALCGKTSEDVAENLFKGCYGNVEETGLLISSALKSGYKESYGAGEAMGMYLNETNFSHAKYSIMYHAYKLNIPLTIHPAFGTDFIHIHPNFSGKVLGVLAERDFLQFASVIAKISSGGVFLNIGSAVIMPEIFLKALAMCTAQGIDIKDFYTAVFDFNKQYRPNENVVKRPAQSGGKGYYFVGHHEIMVPLLAAFLLEKM